MSLPSLQWNLHLPHVPARRTLVLRLHCRGPILFRRHVRSGPEPVVLTLALWTLLVGLRAHPWVLRWGRRAFYSGVAGWKRRGLRRSQECASVVPTKMKNPPIDP